ncbi:MAG TPA: hypothetical protein V6C52_12395 [Coleofasciculaceae cyanobacterium]|jgi:hypothetical protein
MKNIFQVRSPGNTTVEYLFIALCTIGVAIGALFLLGENLQNALAGLKSDMTASITGTKMQKMAIQMVSQEIPSTTAPGDNQALLCTALNSANKMCMNVSNNDLGIDMDPSEKVMTIGSLGNDVTLQQFKDVLAFASENLPPKEVDNLTATLLKMLAETGYTAASKQAQLGDICAQNKDKCQNGVMAQQSGTQDANDIAAVEKKADLTETAGEMAMITQTLETVVSKKPDTLTPEEKVTVAAISQEIITDAQDTSATMVPKLIDKTEPTDTNTDSAGLEQVSQKFNSGI